MKQLVITIVGEDRPGIVEDLSSRVAEHGGNWLSSSMSNLAGQFAGIIEVAVSDEEREALAAAIGGLPGLQVHSVVGDAPLDVAGRPVAELEVVGLDQPGIVKRLTAVLKQSDVNLLQFASWCEPAPNTGETLFRAMVEFVVHEALDMEQLQERLEALAGELAVDIELDPGD